MTSRHQRSTLMGEKPVFALNPTTIAGEGSALTHHAMTGHDDCHGVGPVRAAHRSHRGWASDPPGELRIGQSRSAGDFA